MVAGSDPANGCQALDQHADGEEPVRCFAREVCDPDLDPENMQRVDDPHEDCDEDEYRDHALVKGDALAWVGVTRPGGLL